MVSKSQPKPTDGELAILRVLWSAGSAMVRQVHEVLSAERETGYTTVLEMLQIMTEQGLSKIFQALQVATLKPVLASWSA